MKESFKIEKELLFKHNIKDITSISLDRDYKIDNNVITLYKALKSTTGAWDNSKWTDEINIDEDNVYSYINIELKYDIGVM